MDRLVRRAQLAQQTERLLAAAQRAFRQETTTDVPTPSLREARVTPSTLLLDGQAIQGSPSNIRKQRRAQTGDGLDPLRSPEKALRADQLSADHRHLVGTLHLILSYYLPHQENLYMTPATAVNFIRRFSSGPRAAIAVLLCRLREATHILRRHNQDRLLLVGHEDFERQEGLRMQLHRFESIARASIESLATVYRSKLEQLFLCVEEDLIRDDLWDIEGDEFDDIERNTLSDVETIHRVKIQRWEARQRTLIFGFMLQSLEYMERRLIKEVEAEVFYAFDLARAVSLAEQALVKVYRQWRQVYVILQQIEHVEMEFRLRQQIVRKELQFRLVFLEFSEKTKRRWFQDQMLEWFVPVAQRIAKMAKSALYGRTDTWRDTAAL
jgi:hypothetical protein